MSYKLIISTPASEEYEEASQYYRTKSSELAGRFSEELLDVIERIEQNPFQFQIEDDIYRRAHLKRFPFTIFYEVHVNSERRLIEVVAIWHQSNRPDGWK